MVGSRDKGKAKASRTGDAPIKMKIGRRRGGAAAFPDAALCGLEVAARSRDALDLEVAARSREALDLEVAVPTKEIMAFDVAHKLRSGRRVLVPNTDKPRPQRFRKREKPVYDLSWKIAACAKVALEHYNRLNEMIPKQHLFVLYVEFAHVESSILLLEDT